MKKYISLILCMIVAVGALDAQTIDRLIITKKDGSSITLYIKNQPTISFEDECMTVTASESDTNPVTVYFDELDTMKPISAVTVEDIVQGLTEISIYMDGDIINFLNIGDAPQAFKMVDLQGRIVAQDTVSGTHSINRNDYARGIYVISIGTFNVKIKF